MKNADDIKRIFDEAVVETNPSKDEKILESITAAYKQTDKAQSEKSELNIWRIIMKSPITKLAAAACVIIAVLIGIKHFVGSVDGASVVWANVSQKMETIYSFTCRKQESGNKESIYWYSVDYGTKSEHYSDGELTVICYRLRKTKELVAIFPPEKMYNHLRLSNEAMSKMEQENPRQIVRCLLAADYKPLGRDIIDGIRVEGVEVKDQNIFKPPGTEPEWQDFVARMWVDVETQLPVRLEAEHSLAGSSVRNIIVTDQFQWNVELNASDFEPNIPAGYAPGTDEFKTTTQQK